jgi:phenylalanyl-tRNA synthetase beta chain
MPVLKFKPGRVEEALRLSLEEALKVMEKLKIEVEVDEEGYVNAELEVDRPDMYLLEGIARQVNGLLGREVGLPQYEVYETDYVLEVGEVPTRPCISAGIVWDVNVDEDFLEELIQFQEKLHISLGEKRRRFAIGLHDLEKVPSRKLKYAVAELSERFVPLHHEREMSIREVLEATEQGREYGKLALGAGGHPAIFAGSDIISLPPVINADITRIEPGTKHIFFDVTGVDCKAVRDVARLIAFTLAERSRSRRVGLVKLVGQLNGVEPESKPRLVRMELARVQRLIGLELGGARIVESLKRMRFDAWVEDGYLVVRVPQYRIDVIGWADIAEEVVLGVGLDSIGAERPKTMLRGRLLTSRIWERVVRRLLAGYGFVEVKTYTLTSCQELRRVGVDAGELVVVSNPSVAQADCYRVSLLPSMLRIASKNMHIIPLKVFEAGDIARRCSSKASCTHPDRMVDYRKVIGILVMDDKVGYEDIQAIVYGLVRLTGDNVEKIEEYQSIAFIPGRAAEIATSNGLIVRLGEVNPELLEEYEIVYPVAYAEIDYTNLKTPRGAAAVPRP